MDFLIDGAADAPVTVMLAHGAGAGMDTPFMEQVAKGLADDGLRVVRFEFAYMASRRTPAGRKPPPRAEKVMDEYRQAVAELGCKGKLVIGGKSMGGRVASMVAQELFDAAAVAGLVCLGYPFHPPGQPEKLRTAHLETLSVPTLICQGTRDPFAGREEVETYSLSPAIKLEWLGDGDHDFKARKASGFTTKDNMTQAIAAMAGFAGALA